MEVPGVADALQSPEMREKAEQRAESRCTAEDSPPEALPRAQAYTSEKKTNPRFTQQHCGTGGQIPRHSREMLNPAE